MTEDTSRYDSVDGSFDISSYKLDTLMDGPLMSVYCKCGRIVVLDRTEMRLKLSLGKELQCMRCRNQRISEEIDALNNLYNGIVEEDC